MPLCLAQRMAAFVLDSAEGALDLVCGHIHSLLGLVAALLQSAFRVMVLVALHRQRECNQGHQRVLGA
jgi:hypothetical protein